MYSFVSKAHFPGRRLLVIASLLVAVVAAVCPPGASANIFVRIETDLGNIDVELFDEVAPNTVANFLNYVGDGDYDGSFISRHDEGFVIQAGGWIYKPEDGSFSAGGTSHIPIDDPIENEFNLSNLRATVAMAKGANPDSATSEWFINLADNSAALDNPLNAGGFTVFGLVTEDSMAVVDAITAIPTFNFAPNPPFGFPGFATLPLVDFPSGLPVENSNLVLLNRVFVLAADQDQDGIADAIEDTAPNGGDGNNDGFPDRTQARVASFPDAQGYQATIESPDSTRLVAVAALADGFLTANFDTVGRLFDGVNLGHGFFQFTVKDIAPGGVVDVKLTLHDGPAPDAFFKFGPTPDDLVPHWYKFDVDNQTGATISGNVITLRLEDGGRGDSDLLADGSITDPGAPATRISTSKGSSGGGGGCSIAEGPVDNRPGLEWLLLAVFLFWLRVARRRVIR